tara:strand:- start:619 stop:1293 length:675 start_codon:yes stop_codon:yes gene_type:complete
MSMLLRVENLTKQYPGQNGSLVHALRGVSLDLEEGDFAAIQGPSGCGKSTLLLAAGALLQPAGGTVSIDGDDPYRLSSEQRAQFRARYVGFVFQQFHLVPYLSVRENIVVPELAGDAEGNSGDVDALLEQFQLKHRAEHPPAKLSTGERQRVALARALFNKPRLLLADEPTGNLDRENADIVLDHFRRFAEAGGGVLLVTHDPHAAARAGRTINIVDGCLAGTD